METNTLLYRRLTHTTRNRIITVCRLKSRRAKFFSGKLIIAQIVEDSSRLLWNLKVITIFTRARHWSLSEPENLISSRSVLILSSHVRLAPPSGLVFRSCWNLIPYWHGWSPEKTLLLPVAVKVPSLKSMSLFQCARLHYTIRHRSYAV
jgi:hypothetical protein